MNLSRYKKLILLLSLSLLALGGGFIFNRYDVVPDEWEHVPGTSSEVSPAVLGNIPGGGIGTPTFFKRLGNQIGTINAAWDFYVGGSASSSADFAVDPGLNLIRINGVNYSFPVNDGDASQRLTTDGSGTLTWETVTGGGGSGGSPDLRLGFSGAFTNVGSISFNNAHFDLPLNVSNQASLSLDWGAGGPASLSQAETITGNWVNTANPWADNEVVDELSVIGGIIGANSISGTQTTTGTLTLGDNGDLIVVSATNWDLDANGLFTTTTASLSGNFEVVGYASISDTLYVDTGTNGRVGIGTSTPSEVLQLLGTGDVKILVRTDASGTAGAAALRLAGDNDDYVAFDYARDTTNIWGFGMQPTTTDGNHFLIWDATNSDTVLFRIETGTGHASVSRGNLEIEQRASASLYYGSAFSIANNECSGDGDTLAWENGVFTCGDDDNSGGGGGGGITSIRVKEQAYSSVAANYSAKVSSLSFDPGAFSLAAAASSANETVVRIDYTNGPASRAAAQTISGLWTFSGGASFSGATWGTIDSLLWFGAGSAVLPSTSFATFDTRNDFLVLDFGDITAATRASKSIFIAVMPADYDDGTISVKLHYSATSATSGDVVWDVQFERVGDGQLDIDNGGWATAQTATCTVPGTTGLVDVCTITFTQAQADGVLKGELFRMRVIRDTTDSADTVTTDIELHAVEITQ